MRSFLFTFILGLFCSFTYAQKQSEASDKIFNFGATIGCNSIFPIINSITIDDVELEEIYHVKYKVGYQGSVFCRINMDRFFIQPSISWRRSEADIIFTIPPSYLPGELGNEENAYTTSLSMQKRSLQTPVMIGYNIVRKGPYGLSFMAGPNVKYGYKTRYTSPENNQEFLSENTPWQVSISMGIGVRIWQLFFDFCYELGINQLESDFKSKSNNSTSSIPYNVQIDKHTNVLNFSLGVLF